MEAHERGHHLWGWSLSRYDTATGHPGAHLTLPSAALSGPSLWAKASPPRVAITSFIPKCMMVPLHVLHLDDDEGTVTCTPFFSLGLAGHSSEAPVPLQAPHIIHDVISGTLLEQYEHF